MTPPTTDPPAPAAAIAPPGTDFPPPPAGDSKDRRRKRLETYVVPALLSLYNLLLYLREQCRLPVETDYTVSGEYKAALDFFKSFERKPDVKYDWVLAYAKSLHERCESTDKALDDKADSIIKYLGGGSALLTFGALLSIKPEKPETCLLGLAALVSLVPSLFFAILAVRAAIKVRRPQSAATPPSVTKAIHLAENYPTTEEAELNFVLIYHPICESYAIRNAQKAEYLKYAHKFYGRSLMWVFLPVVVICIALAVLAFRPQPTTTPATSPSSAGRLYCPTAPHAPALRPPSDWAAGASAGSRGAVCPT